MNERAATATFSNEQAGWRAGYIRAHRQEECRDGAGIGWIDVHLLALALLNHVPVWTRDRKLNPAAGEVWNRQRVMNNGAFVCQNAEIRQVSATVRRLRQAIDQNRMAGNRSHLIRMTREGDMNA